MCVCIIILFLKYKGSNIVDLFLIKGFHPAFVAAIASRESRAGAALDSNHRGDGGRAFGVMQV